MDPDEPYDDLLPLLLKICEDFFAGAGPAVRHQVDAFMQTRNITGGPGWLIDMLALTRQSLELPAEPGEPGLRQTPDAREGGAQTHRH